MRSARRLYRFSVGYAVVAVLALAGAMWLALRSATISAAPASELLSACRRLLPVSYTHLTLPTICSV